ncbi:hypothetical protein GCM10011371_08310 [Novosphingobium marinum]|uniref:Uncharacterized protein n=1 Tax=Novosphingobium marinum TaxID=1514948 RepID=A0A7Z0BSU8_9SPHN|nr:hypothetical protein [Novosphingobium marinum]NYH94519.1 hypothetical protein [Novosphingobium marinum]GGC22969.1 hypothetical protein GCM10011371_08310 [Novosphingobium marinum]
MEWETPWFGFAMSAAFAFIRWRWPILPREIASGGLIASVAVIVLSWLSLPWILVASLSLNAGFATGWVDAFLTRRKGIGGSSTSTIPISSERQRKIDAGRKLVTDYNRQSGELSFARFLATEEAWLAVRQHLNPEVVKKIENPRLTMSSRGDVRDGKLYLLRDELDRLEREWDLT